MFLCLSLGFMGRYRQARGEGELERVRAADARRDRGAAPGRRIRSCRSAGEASPCRTSPHGTAMPVWVALAGAAALCGALFLWTSTGLNAASDGLQAHVLATPPTHMPQVIRAAVVQPLPPPPPPPEPTALDRLRASLKPEIDRGAAQPARHSRDADHPRHRPRDVRVRQRGRAARVAAVAGAHRRRIAERGAGRCR